METIEGITILCPDCGEPGVELEIDRKKSRVQATHRDCGYRQRQLIEYREPLTLEG